MIARTQTGRIRVLGWLRRGVVGFALGYLLIAGGLGAEIILKNSEADRTEHQNILLAEGIKTANAEVQRANLLTVSDAPTDLSAVAKLQSALARLAAGRNCTVAEFRASADPVPYLTRFAKTTSVAGWEQVQTQLSLSGKSQDVTSTLAGLLEENIPFEFDSLEIRRDKVDSAGDATVIGHATLRVLIRLPKEKA